MPKWTVDAVLTTEALHDWPFDGDLSDYLLQLARADLDPACRQVLCIRVLPSQHEGLIHVVALGDT